MEHLTAIELFTGAGGLALGVHHAGFRHLKLVEYDPKPCETIRENNRRRVLRPAWPIEERDVHEVDFGEWSGRVDLLAAGAPCQPFSLGGVHRGFDDNRNLFPQVLRAVRETHPRAVLVENVKGLLRPSFFPYFEYVLLQLERPEIVPRAKEDWRDHKVRLEQARRSAGADAGDYRVRYQILTAANYGVPQLRERVFIVALRSDVRGAWGWPEETHTMDALMYAKWVERSYWDEHGLRTPRVPAELAERVKDLKSRGKPFEKRWRTLRDALRDLPEPIEGQEHLEVLNHVGIPGARSYKGHDGSPLDDPAKTLKAGVHGVPGGEGTLRRDDGSVRYLTVREAARVQCFPDRFYFPHVRTTAMRQIGNAVPVELASAVARQLAEYLSGRRR